jgi:hypothetical protein
MTTAGSIYSRCTAESTTQTAPPPSAGSTRLTPSLTTSTARADQRSRIAHATGRRSPPETLQQHLDRELRGVVRATMSGPQNRTAYAGLDAYVLG